MTFAALNKIVSKSINIKAHSLKIRFSMKEREVEKLIDIQFAVTVQIKDKTAKILVPNSMSLGQATREEYK